MIAGPQGGSKDGGGKIYDRFANRSTKLFICCRAADDELRPASVASRQNKTGCRSCPANSRAGGARVKPVRDGGRRDWPRAATVRPRARSVSDRRPTKTQSDEPDRRR